MRELRNRRVMVAGLLALALSAATPVRALRSYGLGNDPMEDRGWPTGTLALVNLPARVGTMEGPSGGDYSFAYRCADTAAFNAVLQLFGAIRVPRPVRLSLSPDGEANVSDSQPLLLVVHDRQEGSEGQTAWSMLEAPVDWTLSVWVPESFHRNFNSAGGLRFTEHPYLLQPVPPPRIDVYAGGDGPIVWEAVEVPATVRVVDKRAVAFPAVEGGGEVRGTVFDMATHGVVAGATVIIEERTQTGEIKEAARAATDAAGAFRIAGIPQGFHGIRVEAEGYAARSAGWFDNRRGYGRRDEDILLARAGTLGGLVADPEGNPLAGIRVSVQSARGIDGQGYGCADKPTATSDERGRFELRGLPAGSVSVRCREPSLHMKSINANSFIVGAKPWEEPQEVIMVLEGTGSVRGKVADERGVPPARPFIVEIEPEDGAGVGKWSGSAECKPDGTFGFSGVPPGVYIMTAKPNPGRADEATPPARVTITSNKSAEIEIVYAEAEE